MPDSTPQVRPRFKFTLRALFALVGLTAATLAVASNYGKDQQRLVAKIEDRGGEVWLSKGSHLWPFWNSRLVSRSRIEAILGVTLETATPSPELIQQIVSLPSLEQLTLTGDGVTAKDIALVGKAVNVTNTSRP